MKLTGPDNEVALLNQSDVPDGSLLAIFSDMHIGIEDTAAVNIAMECCIRTGITHFIGNGDMWDCGAASRHPDKKRAAAIDHGRLLKEAESGEWLLKAAVKQCGWGNVIYGEGNHEDWINQAANDPAFAGTVTVKSALGLPDRLTMLPNGYQIRLGSLLIEHGDHVFKRGAGGKYPARKLLDTYPDCTSIAGHVHKMDEARRIGPDEHGVNRSRRAITTGHLSLEHKHRDYAPRHPNWHQSFTLVRVFWEGGRPKYTIEPVEIFRDGRNRPSFTYLGRLYR